VFDIIGTLLTTPRRPLATSALPDAPVVDDAQRRARSARLAIAATLRRFAAGWTPVR
jgi:hypothetical protein